MGRAERWLGSWNLDRCGWGFGRGVGPFCRRDGDGSSGWEPLWVTVWGDFEMVGLGCLD